jgi:ubiquitin carboxyl-terminal hydrolase MINDY-1/2
MDLNPLFTSSTAFRPATTGGELALFASVGISLLHGWLVDPASPEYAAVSRVGDYDSAVNLIVEADVLTRGLLVGDNVDQDGDGSGPSSQAAAGPSHTNINLTDEEKQKVEDGEYDSIFPAL